MEGHVRQDNDTKSKTEANDDKLDLEPDTLHSDTGNTSTGVSPRSIEHTEAQEAVKKTAAENIALWNQLDLYDRENSALHCAVERYQTAAKHQTHDTLAAGSISHRALRIGREAIYPLDTSMPSTTDELKSLLAVPVLCDIVCDFDEESILDRTLSSITYKAFYKEARVVCKQYLQTNRARHEYNMIHNMKTDRGVPHAYGVYHATEQDDDLLVTSYVGPHCLGNEISQKKIILDPFGTMRILYELGKTIIRLQEQDIVFNNIQPQSVVYSSVRNPNLVGFSKAVHLTSAICWSKHLIEQHSEYLAPEVVTGKAPTLASDIYSYGLVMDKVMSPLYQKELLPWHIMKLASECLNKDPLKRPVKNDFVKLISALFTFF